MNFSYTIIFLFLVGFFLELSPEKHSDVDRRIALTVEIREPNPCQPDTPRNRQIIESFLSTTSPERTNTGTGHLNPNQVELLADTTAACTFFLADLDEAINEMHADTAEKVYALTFYRVANFYFASQSFHTSSDPNRLILGLNFLYIYDDDLEFVEGFAF